MGDENLCNVNKDKERNYEKIKKIFCSMNLNS